MLMSRLELLGYVINTYSEKTATRIIEEIPKSNTEYYDVYYFINDSVIAPNIIKEYIIKHNIDGEITFRTRPINNKEELFFYKLDENV